MRILLQIVSYPLWGCNDSKELKSKDQHWYLTIMNMWTRPNHYSRQWTCDGYFPTTSYLEYVRDIYFLSFLNPKNLSEFSIVTMSWGFWKHHFGIPGVRPMFSKPKLHKESKNGFKKINYRPYRRVIFSNYFLSTKNHQINGTVSFLIDSLII